MELTPDQTVFFRWGFFVLNATIVYSWFVMALLTGLAYSVTRDLVSGVHLPTGQNWLEAVVAFISSEIRNVIAEDPAPFLPFIGTLYLFIAVANLLSPLPVYEPPTASLSTTAALAVCVLFAVPIFGIRRRGLKAYLHRYVRPTPLMLPFRIIQEFTRTLALALRLFGNIMSGTVAIAVVLSLAPFFFPITLRFLELIIGQVQAYIFAILAIVYIGSAARREKDRADPERKGEPNSGRKGTTHD